MNLWSEIYSHIEPSPEEEAAAYRLLREYREQRYLSYTPSQLIEMPDNVVIAFYYFLSLERGTDSPLQHLADSSWMSHSSFCFINIRACGTEGKFGTILDAAKLIPAIRASAIHLGPFTSYDFECIYAVSSVRTVAEQILHPALRKAGLSGIKQIHALVQAIHLLGKTAGYDLEPHVTSFAITALEHPEYFRWIQIDPKTHELMVDESSILQHQEQTRLQGEIRKLVQAGLKEKEWDSLEVYLDEENRQPKKAVYHELIGTLIEKGYWTIPSQSWKGMGLPRFRGYDPEKKSLLFEYLSPEGEDISHIAYNIVTPFAFYRGLKYNRAGKPAALPDQDCIDYFASIFPFWQKECDFDFVRYDSVDHIFDSCGGYDIPWSDRPTPRVLTQAISATKYHRAATGNMAERMGQEVREYARLGFDTLLGVDMFHLEPRQILQNAIKMSQRITVLNENEGMDISLCLATDTHDTGNPGLIGTPLVDKLDIEVLAQRQFMSRFLNIGSARRSKYEVVGYADKSHGLFQSNVRDIPLNWTGNMELNKIYHRIEDIYQQHKEGLRQSRWGEHLSGEEYCAWQILGQDEQWICIVNQEAIPDIFLSIPFDWKEGYIYKGLFTPLDRDDKMTESREMKPRSFALLHYQKEKIRQRIDV